MTTQQFNDMDLLEQLLFVSLRAELTEDCGELQYYRAEHLVIEALVNPQSGAFQSFVAYGNVYEAVNG